MRTVLTFLFSFFLWLVHVSAQTDTVNKPVYPKRKIALASTSAALTIGSLFYLNEAWYSDYNTGKFHFFNDNEEWLQMDKAGHVFTTYQMSTLMMDAFERVGYSRKQKLIIGGGIGFVYMTAVECMDGFSRGWGYSWGDQLANTIGTGISVSQEAIWKEQRIQLKFSYAKSGLAQYNPSLLGKNNYTQVLKDYNGQTYWLSVNPSSFIKRSNSFPKWLNVAVGYGAYGMLGGFSNDFVVEDNSGNVIRFERERRVYVSLDVDLRRIKTKSRVLKSVFSVINILKLPAPALQFSKKGLRGYYLYY